MAKGRVGGRRIAARGDAKAEKSNTAEKPIALRPTMLIGLMIAAALGAALAIFQWVELVHTQRGGTTFCSIDATFNCVSVWESTFAKSIHRATRIPVAAWGLAWSMTGLAAAALAFIAGKKNKSPARELGAIRMTAAIGVVVSIVLFIVTVTIGTFCLTCWATYAFVLSYALFAWKIAPLSTTTRSDWFNGASLAAVLTAGSYLLLLYPGTNTPVEAVTLSQMIEQPKKQGSGERPKSTGDLLGDFLIQLPGHVQQSVADNLHWYRTAPVKGVTINSRRVLGSPNAPVKIVEWSDIRCGHCKSFSETLRMLSQGTPPDAFSVELRMFPLDGMCNANVRKEMTDGTGVRCLAAKALLCVEQTDGFKEAQEKMFEQQNALTQEMILSYASQAGMPRSELEACIKSPAVEAKLKEDVDLAMKFGLEGTPLVIINGREAQPYEPFIYALVLANGDPNAQGWGVLPKASGRMPHDGHNH